MAGFRQHGIVCLSGLAKWADGARGMSAVPAELDSSAIQPGIGMPGYCHSSLRDGGRRARFSKEALLTELAIVRIVAAANMPRLTALACLAAIARKPAGSACFFAGCVEMCAGIVHFIAGNALNRAGPVNLASGDADFIGGSVDFVVGDAFFAAGGVEKSSGRARGCSQVSRHSFHYTLN